jgi:hypothetical protein
MESRIIALSPVAVNSKGDTLDLYWLYYPEIRKHLATQKPPAGAFPSKVRTMDDVFFFRCFASTVYKESNRGDLKITDYTETRKKALEEAIRIELEMIETEEDIWQGIWRDWD